METVFDKIISGSIPSYKIYDDTYCTGILDINPVKKGHCLLISKLSVATINELGSNEFAHMSNIVQRIAKQMRTALKADAVNVLINDGKAAGQEIPHVHIHIIPRFESDGGIDIGKKEKYADEEMEKYFQLLKIK